VNDKRFHIAVRLSEEEKWKLREIAARKKLKVSELIMASIKEIIKQEEETR